MSRARPHLVALPALAILGGCQLLIGLDGGKPQQGTGGTGGAGGATSSTSSGTGGTGGTSTSSGTGGDCGSGVPCSTPTDCPAPGNECLTRTCTAGCCGMGFVTALTATAAQTSGDCQKVVCDGAGSTTSVVDDNDTPPDQDDCHTGTCVSGATKQVPKAAGMMCSFGGGKVCGDPATTAAGQCVACNAAAECATGQVCAANQCAGLLLLAAGATGTWGATYQAGGTWGAPVSLGGASTDEISLTFTPAGGAVGVLRIPQGAAASEQVWYTTWAAGTWAPAKAIAAATVFTRAAPSISAGSARAQLVFHGTDYKHYYASYAGGAWSPVEQVGGATGQSFGAMPAAIAALADDASVVFFDGAGTPANEPTAQDRTGSAWQAKVLMGSDASFTSSPAVVAMTGSLALMAVYVRSDGSIVSQTRTGAAWSAPAVVPGAATAPAGGRPALAALPADGAIMAFRGNDGNAYYATYNPGTGTWSGATALASPNVAITGVPVLARGIGGDVAEIAFVEPDGKAYHARLVGNAWTAPTAVVTQQALTAVAIATWP